MRAILDAEETHRALLATLILAGLRIGELISLRWRDVDLARGKLKIQDSKTEAGERDVDITPDLLELLKMHRANSSFTSSADLVFPTSTGRPRDRSNILRDVVRPAVAVASEKLVEAGLPPIASKVTNHTMRRTFASLLYEAGASPREVMDQMGHTRADLALEIYAKKMDRSRETGARMDALIKGSWSEKADVSELESFSTLADLAGP